MAAEGQFGARVVERRHHQTCRTVEPEPLPEYAAGVVVNLYAPALEVTAVDGLVALERAAVRLGRARARVPRVLWGGDDGDVAMNEVLVGVCSAEYDLLPTKPRCRRLSGAPQVTPLAALLSKVTRERCSSVEEQVVIDEPNPESRGVSATWARGLPHPHGSVLATSRRHS